MDERHRWGTNKGEGLSSEKYLYIILIIAKVSWERGGGVGLFGVEMLLCTCEKWSLVPLCTQQSKRKST